ncbi:MAG: DUF192 domain-containing protein [Chloroflexota bacterium]|nr:DUF192 domain-containing protein [Chloroflexota bacterium]
MRVYNLTRHQPLMTQGELADSLLKRLRGLISHPPLQSGDGLLLPGCRWIHTFLMDFPIDVLYLDSKHRVVHLTPDMSPNRIGPPVPKAHLVVELPSGTIAQTETEVGDQLEIRNA